MKLDETSDVFISFATADEHVASKVVKGLEESKLSCWFYLRQEQNLPGEKWAASISQALKGCQVVVLLYSAEAGASRYVQREISMAVDLKLPILTVRLDDSPLIEGADFLLAGTQFLDGIGKSIEEWLQMLKSRLGDFIIVQNIFPLESILQRGLKVEATDFIIDFLFPSQSVVVAGIGLGLNLGDIYSGQRHERIIEGVRNDLMRCVQLSQAFDYGIFTVESKEHLYLLVGVAESTHTAAIQQVENRLLEIASEVKQRCAGKIELCQHELETESLSASKIRRIPLAEFFTNLGKVVPIVTSAASSVKADPKGGSATTEVIDPKLRSCLNQFILKARRDGFLLPRLLKRKDAEAHLRLLGWGGKGWGSS